MWFLWLIISLLGLAWIYVYLNTPACIIAEVPTPLASFIVQWLSALETTFFNRRCSAVSYIWAMKIHICQHGWHRSKILLLAFAGYSGLILVSRGFLRLRAVFPTRIFPPMQLGLFFAFGNLAAIGSSTYLSWIFWLPCYLGRPHIGLPGYDHLFALFSLLPDPLAVKVVGIFPLSLSYTLH